MFGGTYRGGRIYPLGAYARVWVPLAGPGWARLGWEGYVLGGRKICTRKKECVHNMSKYGSATRLCVYKYTPGGYSEMPRSRGL